MANRLAHPFSIVDAVLKLGEDTFQNACAKIELVSTYSNPSLDTVDGQTITAADAARRTLEITLAQDHTDADSLHEYLLANDGQAVAFEYHPQSGGKGFAGTCILRAGKVGGAGKTLATSDVSLPVTGPVTRTAPLVVDDPDPENPE